MQKKKELLKKNNAWSRLVQTINCYRNKIATKKKNYVPT